MMYHTICVQIVAPAETGRRRAATAASAVFIPARAAEARSAAGDRESGSSGKRPSRASGKISRVSARMNCADGSPRIAARAKYSLASRWS